MDENTPETADRWVQSARVPYGDGRDIDIGVEDDRPGGRIVGARGHAADRVNRGRLGPKGLDVRAANALTNEGLIPSAALVQAAVVLPDGGPLDTPERVRKG